MERLDFNEKPGVVAMAVCPQPTCDRKIVEFADGTHRKISKGFPEFRGRIIPFVLLENCNHHGGDAFNPSRHLPLVTRNAREVIFRTMHQ